MLKREVAKRLFAKEFEAARPLEPQLFEAFPSFFGKTSDLSLAAGKGDSKAPNFLISPFGLLINRVFVVGVLTEVDKVGEQNDLWKARVVDPTGAFTVYAGQFQPEASIFFSTVEAPVFVALSGKARVYEPEKGSVFVSIRAEEVNVVDEALRNRWVVDCTALTLERFEAFSEALLSDFSGLKLSEYLQKNGVSPELAAGISLALARDWEGKLGTREGLDAFLSQLGKVIKEGLSSLDLDSDEKAGADFKAFALELLKELGGGKGVEYAKFLEVAVSKGISEELLDEALRSLLSDGLCYEPRIGVIRPVL
ncbi:MAG: DNA-binding protein [Methanosarcinaceae archaeon]|nr:DNA-binding protein [Methanosarcinaceae archaeon]